MDILDEVLQVRINPKAGKVGCNKSDVVKLRRMLEEGSSSTEIALTLGVRIDIIEKFVDLESKPDEAEDKPVKKATKKKAKKAKSSDNEN